MHEDMSPSPEYLVREKERAKKITHEEAIKQIAHYISNRLEEEVRGLVRADLGAYTEEELQYVKNRCDCYEKENIINRHLSFRHRINKELY